MIKNTTVLTKDKIVESMDKSLVILKKNWFVLAAMIIITIICNIVFWGEEIMMYINILFAVGAPAITISNILTAKRLKREKSELPEKITYNYTFNEKNFDVRISNDKKNANAKVEYDAIFTINVNEDILIIRTLEKKLFSVDLNAFDNDEDKNFVIEKLRGGCKNVRK